MAATLILCFLKTIILGMAYLNSMCSEAWSVSENEEMFNAVTVHIAGHELGHKYAKLYIN